MINVDKDLVLKLQQIAEDNGFPPTRDEFVKITGIQRSSFNCNYNDILEAAGYRSKNKKPSKIEPYKPKILIIDIETSLMDAKIFRTGEQRISHSDVSKDWNILSFAAKELNNEKIIYFDTRENPHDDHVLCLKLHELLNDIDIFVAHNVNFDLKKIRARFLFHDLPPLRPFRSICTLKIARKYFSLTSNSLDYLAKYLNVTRKSEHGKFKGKKLWEECDNGNIEAFDEMQDYNITDIIVLEEIYLRLRRYDNSIRFNVFAQSDVCECGSDEYRQVDPIATNAGVFRAFQCIGCMKVYRKKENLISSQIRSSQLV
jgi:uncharacterized protein YprB with RNaseH-like and TPR domain